MPLPLFIKKTMLIVLLILIPAFCFTWGFYGHRLINKQAVFSLPMPLIRFYKANIEYITEQSVAPDRRRYLVAEEGARHYLDVDHYGSPDSIPGSWTLAEQRFGTDSLRAHGILPWHIETVLYRLTKAFEERDSLAILRLSADIGHYLADAHVPLHTTSNYNGQKTGQHGLHAFWESRLPELFSGSYSFWVGKCSYITDPRSEIRKIIRSSYAAVDSVLFMEKQLSSVYPPDRKYSMDEKNGQLIRVFSEEYSKQYHLALNGMVERRMRSAILTISSFWYTAWVNAGQPDLVFGNQALSEEEQEEKQATPSREHEH